MDFRRSGQLDERRRRVLRDEIASPTDDEKDDASAASAASASKSPVRAYGEAVLATRQPKLSDLIPLRPLHQSILALAGLTAIAAVVAAYSLAADPATGMVAAPLAAFDLQGAGNLAGWLSALLLAGGAAAALAVFSIRVHRVDDYRGRYRVWLWTAAALLLASADAATGLRRAVGSGLEWLGGGGFAGSADICWLGVYVLACGPLLVRLGLETWNALPAFSTLCGSALLYLIAGLGAVGLMPGTESVVGQIAFATLSLLAHFSGVMAVMLFARHVHLDAQGRLLVSVQKVPKKKPRSRAKLSVVKDDSADGRSRKAKPAEPAKPTTATASTAKAEAPLKFNASSPAAGTKPQSGAKIQASTASYPADDDDDDDEDMDDGSNLSRAERKKLKRLNRREQRRAA